MGSTVWMLKANLMCLSGDIKTQLLPTQILYTAVPKLCRRWRLAVPALISYCHKQMRGILSISQTWSLAHLYCPWRRRTLDCDTRCFIQIFITSRRSRRCPYGDWSLIHLVVKTWIKNNNATSWTSFPLPVCTPYPPPQISRNLSPFACAEIPKC